MKILPFTNLQAGIADDPSREDIGGFEFAAGMDIFSEPGVMKASLALAEVTYGASATPAATPTWAVSTYDSGLKMYVIAGDKLLESTDGTTFSLFRTNSQGANLGLGIFNGYVWYAAASKLGRATVGNSGTANDTFLTIETDAAHHPITTQGGTMKVGAGRYVSSVDESSALTSQALKLPVGYRVTSLADHFTRLFIGTRFGTETGAITISEASVFSWGGTVLASGSALPDTVYKIALKGMNALLADGQYLYGFPDSRNIYLFDGARFGPLKRIFPSDVSFTVAPGAIAQLNDTNLFSGNFSGSAGVFQMKSTPNGMAVCQAFVPAGATPGQTTNPPNIQMVHVANNGVVYIGYLKTADTSYHIEKTGANRQDGALVRTLWHRAGTDKLKRWYGVRPNFKPFGATMSVAVSYRTERDASFTSAGTVTNSNLGKPIFLTAQPRSREIQWKFVYTVNGGNTPELLGYDNLYEETNSSR